VNNATLFLSKTIKSTDMRNLISLIAILCLSLSLAGQSLTDALRYSNLIQGGTSRVIGTGSSFGSMGGDFGVLGINPAGISEFKTSELMFSFSFNGGETHSSLENNTFVSTGHANEPRIENLGIVFSARPRGAGLVTNNLAIGFTHYNNYNQDFNYEGYSKGSITERFAERANGRDPDFFDPFESQLAWETGALFDFDGDLVYETDFDTIQDVYKSQSVSRSGRINELSIAWAGKFDKDLSLGVAIGIPFISFEEDKIYREEDLDDRTPFFNELEYGERLATSGTGFNFKIGLGYVLEKTLRFGLAYQSPTYYSLDDNYFTILNYSFTDSEGRQEFESGSPDGRFNYKLTTPSRLTMSVGTLFKSDAVKGFVNFDANYLNYTANQFDFTVDNNDPSEAEFEREVNTEIDQQLQSVFNFNIGGEIAFERIRLRAGVGLLGSPYAVDNAFDFSNVYSLGFGYRANRIYFDVAYQYRTLTEGYIPYQVLDQKRLQNIDNETTFTKLSFTVGFKI